jgi:hypothetical protein
MTSETLETTFAEFGLKVVEANGAERVSEVHVLLSASDIEAKS